MKSSKTIKDINGVDHPVQYGNIIRDSVTGIEGTLTEINYHIAGCVYFSLNYAKVSKDDKSDFDSMTISNDRAIYISVGNEELENCFKANPPQIKYPLGSKVKFKANTTFGYISIISIHFSGEDNILIIRPLEERVKTENADLWSNFKSVSFIDAGKTEIIKQQIEKRERDELDIDLNDHVHNVLTGAQGLVTDITEISGGSILVSYQLPPENNKKATTLCADIELLNKI